MPWGAVKGWHLSNSEKSIIGDQKSIISARLFCTERSDLFQNYVDEYKLQPHQVSRKLSFIKNRAGLKKCIKVCIQKHELLFLGTSLLLSSLNFHSNFSTFHARGRLLTNSGLERLMQNRKRVPNVEFCDINRYQKIQL